MNAPADSDSEISFKIGQYLMKLRRRKQSVPVLGATLYLGYSGGSSRGVDHLGGVLRGWWTPRIYGSKFPR